MKNLIVIIFICTLIYSCGKKGDPEYDDLKKKAKMQTFLTNEA